jgi:hypothetical protein
METQTLSDRSRPPYLLGVLCLIPLIGAFVGLGLLLFGLIKYKDKWLCIIGSLGILFTVGIYSYLFYFMMNSDVVKNGFQEISQMQLTSLVKNIEFYKIQHGQYPENLQEVFGDDHLAPVNDPLQMMKQEENSFFNYERRGDKYTLFSSGADGVAHTKDDFFPELNISDSSKLGYTRP